MVHDEVLIKSLLRGARAIARRIKRSNPEIRIDFESIAEMKVAQVLSTWTERAEVSHKEYVLKKHVNRCVRTALIEAIEKEKRRDGLWAVSATEFDDEPSEEQTGESFHKEPLSHGEDMAADGERRYRP